MAPDVGVHEKLTGSKDCPDAISATTPTTDEPCCLEEQVLNCQFSRWHPLFKHCTPRSVVLELSEDVVRYLQEDGVILPRGFEMACGLGVQDDSDDEVDWGIGDDDDNCCTEGTDEGDGDERPDFPGLLKQLSDVISSLGGSVFPKLNWSCPQDAAWVNGGTLKCSLPGDVLCLLKSSTFISHDLSHAFDGCADATRSRPDIFTLVLRKWCNLHPSMLFRCFVRERRLVGVCQRDCTSYYGFLDEEAGRLSGLLQDFFMAEVCKKFPDSDCVADVYVDNRSRVWLLDINPFSSMTDSLLFDWSEDVLAAPLSALPIPQEEETLPPDVFMRLHFEPSPPSGDAAAAAFQRHSSTTAGRPSDVGAQQKYRATINSAHQAELEGHILPRGDEADFEFRCVPSSLHMVPDPMGRYRGPADVGMGTLMSGTGGDGGGLEELIESCRLAAAEG